MRTLAKSCVLLEFFFLFEIVDHDSHRGNTVQALARWRHLVALHEATDALNWAMCPTSHRHICMVIKIASILLAFSIIADYLFAHKLSKRPCYSQHKNKPSYFVVLIDVMSLLEYCGCHLLTIDAVLATIFDVGREICQNHELL